MQLDHATYLAILLALACFFGGRYYATHSKSLVAETMTQEAAIAVPRSSQSEAVLDCS